jgi:ABC-type dipeptide/oligopeptide/nickel transport system permease component
MRRVEWIIKRLAGAVLTLFFVLTFNFVLFRMLPGDAVSNLARSPKLSVDAKAEIAAQFGLDKPMWQQYLIYLRELAQGNLGVSWGTQQPVLNELRDALLNTLPLVLTGTLVAIFFGILSGLFSAWRRGTKSEKANNLVAMAFYSMPSQWLGLMLIFIFSITLGWLPSGGDGSDGNFLSGGSFLDTETTGESIIDYLIHMLLPASTLALILYGEYTLVVRSSLLETMGEDYVMTAKAKGLPRKRILFHHAMRNALLPTTTLVALSLGFIAGGSILIETVFSWPGIGLLTYESLLERDYPMLQGAFLTLAISVIFFNLIADLVYFRLDPRISE